MARQVWKYEPSGRWVRAVVDGVTIADSKRAMLMLESPGKADYYFPPADVRQDLLQRSEHVEKSGYRGVRRFWHVQVGDRLLENAAWAYDAHEGRPDFAGYLAFEWRAMDHWYEEEEEIFMHPRDPYHRVDTIASSRHVEVYVGGVKVADTKRPFLLFETSLPTRYYISLNDVDQAYLQSSTLHTICPYKGTASYYDVVVDGEVYPNVVWYYPDPIAEAPKLKGKLAFWPEKDKRIEIVVDGKRAAG